MKPTKFLIAFLFIGVFILSSRATAMQHEHTYTTVFQQAAQEFNVPGALLMALGWGESHWSMRDGQPSVDHAYGIMGLRFREDFDALGRAAHLIGLDPEVLKVDPAANIRGAAALLRDLADGLAREGYSPPDDRPETWGDALVRYSGISDPVIGLDYLYQVFYHLNFGVTREADDGNAMIRIPKLFLDFETLDEHRKSLWQGRDAITPRSEDYSLARWIPADPSNYTVSNRPSAYPIQYIIIHVTQGTYAGSISWFRNPISYVSAHYVIRSSDGEITQMVRHKDIAWHAANWTYNTRSIGIEHEGWIDQPSWFTTQMYRSSAALTRYIADFYRIPKTRSFIIGHNEVPGATHTDPGRNWDWTYYMQLVSGVTQPAELTSPTPGTRLTGSSVTFAWSAGSGVTEYWLRVGSKENGTDYYDASQETNRSRMVSGLPTDGRTLYVWLYSRIGGIWQYNSYTYTAARITNKAAITSPTPGSTLSGSTVTFAWSAGSGVTEYWLRVGSKENGTDYYDASQETNRSRMVSGLPTDGRTLYVRLYSRIGGIWQYNSYTYTAARNSPFQGSMRGAWKGKCGRYSIQGNFSILIDANGGVSGEYSGDLSGKITGSVNRGGTLSTGAGSGSGGVTWSGRLRRTGGNLSGNGSWRKVSGVCSGSKGTWWSN